MYLMMKHKTNLLVAICWGCDAERAPTLRVMVVDMFRRPFRAVGTLGDIMVNMVFTKTLRI